MCVHHAKNYQSSLLMLHIRLVRVRKVPDEVDGSTSDTPIPLSILYMTLHVYFQLKCSVMLATHAHIIHKLTQCSLSGTLLATAPPQGAHYFLKAF